MVHDIVYLTIIMPSEKFLIYLLYFSRTGIYEELYSDSAVVGFITRPDVDERTNDHEVDEGDSTGHSISSSEWGDFFAIKLTVIVFMRGRVVMPRDLFWAYPNGHPVNYYYLYHPEVKCPLVNLFSLNTAKRKERKRANKLRQKK